MYQNPSNHSKFYKKRFEWAASAHAAAPAVTGGKKRCLSTSIGTLRVSLLRIKSKTNQNENNRIHTQKRTKKQHYARMETNRTNTGNGNAA